MAWYQISYLVNINIYMNVYITVYTDNISTVISSVALTNVGVLTPTSHLTQQLLELKQILIITFIHVQFYNSKISLLFLPSFCNNVDKDSVYCISQLGVIKVELYPCAPHNTCFTVYVVLVSINKSATVKLKAHPYLSIMIRFLEDLR